MDFGLGRMESALEALGLARPVTPSTQVVGTNGKGSTSTLLAAMLSGHGLRVGLYTSPHFLSPRERILVDGRPLPDALWVDAAEAVLRVSQDRDPALRLTYFELLTVMAAWMFRAVGCRAAVFEAGLGGAHDATTALAHSLLLLAPVGMDHVRVIGPTLRDIARDKARAMRPGAPAVSGPQCEEARAVIIRQAALSCSPLFWSEDMARDFPPDWPVRPALPGPHQQGNLRLALAGMRLLAPALGITPDPAALERAAAKAFIPGRLQRVRGKAGEPGFLLDGAHNLPALECLQGALESLGIQPTAMIFACLADKDLDAMLPLAASLTRGPIFVPGLDAPGRAMPPADLAACVGHGATPVENIADALAKVQGMDGTVLLCGSLYLLAEAYRLRPEWLQPGG